MRDGTAESISRDQILGRERRQGNINVPCSADHEQDWQPYPVDPCSDGMTAYVHTNTNNSGCGKKRGAYQSVIVHGETCKERQHLLLELP